MSAIAAQYIQGSGLDTTIGPAGDITGTFYEGDISFKPTRNKVEYKDYRGVLAGAVYNDPRLVASVPLIIKAEASSIASKQPGQSISKDMVTFFTSTVSHGFDPTNSNVKFITNSVDPKIRIGLHRSMTVEMEAFAFDVTSGVAA